MHRAAELLKAAEKHLREARPDIVYVTAAGDFRRGCELVGDLSLVAEVRKLPSGPHRHGGRTVDGPPDRHRALWRDASAGDRLGRASRVFTRLAAGQEMSLDENGLQRGGKLVAAASEDSIYSALGMQPVPPELREGRSDKVARSRRNTAGACHRWGYSWNPSRAHQPV